MSTLPNSPSSAAPWYASIGPAGATYAAIEALPKLGRAINTNARALNALAKKPGIQQDAEFIKAMQDHSSAVQGYLDALEQVEGALTEAVNRGYISADDARRGLTYTPAPSDLGAIPVAGYVAIAAIAAIVIVPIVMILMGVVAPYLLALAITAPAIVGILAGVALVIDAVGESAANMARRTIDPRTGQQRHDSFLDQATAAVNSPAALIGVGVLALIVLGSMASKKGAKS